MIRTVPPPRLLAMRVLTTPTHPPTPLLTVWTLPLATTLELERRHLHSARLERGRTRLASPAASIQIPDTTHQDSAILTRPNVLWERGPTRLGRPRALPRPLGTTLIRTVRLARPLAMRVLTTPTHPPTPLRTVWKRRREPTVDLERPRPSSARLERGRTRRARPAATARLLGTTLPGMAQPLSSHVPWGRGPTRPGRPRALPHPPGTTWTRTVRLARRRARRELTTPTPDRATSLLAPMPARVTT